MNYIVNPMWFYFMSLFDGIDTFTLAICVIILFIWGLSPILFNIIDDENDIEKIIKPLFKKSVIVFVISLMISIAIPGREDMEKMLIASYATEDNISAATNYGKDLVDYIFDKVNGVDKEEKN